MEQKTIIPKNEFNDFQKWLALNQDVSGGHLDLYNHFKHHNTKLLSDY